MPLIGLTFLAPAAGLIGAAVAIPALLLFYFLKLRRRPVRVSSTLLWTQAVQDLQVNAPFRILRLSWLLFLQVALLVLLLGALARPAIDLAASFSGRYVLLIDRSASMNAQDAPDGATRLDEARARAASIIDRLPGDAEVLLLAFAADVETLRAETRNKGSLRRGLDELTPTDQPADLNAAMDVVEAFVARTGEDAAEAAPRVILISDGRLDASAAAPVVGLDESAFRFVRVGPAPGDPIDNLGVADFSAQRDYDDPTLIRAFARILSVRSEPTEFILEWAVDEQVLGRAQLRIDAATEEGPASLSHTFAFENADGGLLEVRLVRADALPVDNTVRMRLRQPSGPAVLVVQAETSGGTYDALQAELLISGIETLDRARVTRLTADEWSATPPERIAAHDLIIFDRVRPDALPPVPTISFGATIPVPGVGLTAFPDGDPRARPTGFAVWRRTHPVLRYVGLNPIRVDRPMNLSLPDDVNGDESVAPGLRVTRLASGASGPLIALIERDGLRRIVVGFDILESTWLRDPSFPVFIAQAVAHLTLQGDESAGDMVRTTEPVVVRAPPTAERLSIDGPLTFTRSITPDAGGRVSLGVLPIVGLYRIEGALVANQRVCVNLLTADETDARTSDELTVAGEARRASDLADAAPREIWRWFVLAALGLLLIEWAIFTWKLRA